MVLSWVKVYYSYFSSSTHIMWQKVSYSLVSFRVISVVLLMQVGSQITLLRVCTIPYEASEVSHQGDFVVGWPSWVFIHESVPVSPFMRVFLSHLCIDYRCFLTWQSLCALASCIAVSIFSLSSLCYILSLASTTPNKQCLITASVYC